MKLYADSSVIDDVLPLVRAGVVTGVTCNPTILDRAGRTSADIEYLYRTLEAAGSPTIFFQAIGRDHAELGREARRIAALGDRAVVKLPATRDGLTIAGALVEAGTPVLVTAVYTVEQVVAAAAVGVQYVAPYYGRLVDHGYDADSMIQTMIELEQESGPEVLVASVRTPTAVRRLVELGVRSVTASPLVLWGLLESTLTGEAVAEFEDTAASWRAAGASWSP